VVDNARTVNPELVKNYGDRFTLFPNENTGGAGGFTRGIKEAIAAPDNFDYVLLMDDDVVVAPQAVQRTEALLSHLHPEYRKHFISGAMLRLDTPTVQHEATAYWNGWRVRPIHGNLDLGNFTNVSKSCIPVSHRRQYAAWWYCVIPIDKQMKNDLPAPLFVNGDDIEYSLRKASGIIHLNGIAIWHESFSGKLNSVKHVYLTVRNGLIINLLHNYSLMRSLQLVLVRFVIQQLKGRNSKSALIIEALHDVLRGPKRVRNLGNPFTHDFSSPVMPRGNPGPFLLVVCRLIREYRGLRRLYKRTFLDVRNREAA
jgi:GT2 family glycosyltransferase